VCLAGRGGARGVLTGAGAAVKVWPVALLAGTPPGQWRRDLAAAAAVLAGVCAVFGGAAVSFLAHQAARGVEIESVAATPLMIWRHAGWRGTVAFRFGAWQLNGAYGAVAQDASRLCLVLAIAAVVGWRLLIASGRARWRPEFTADAPLAATLLLLVAGPVLSPQYLLWVIGLAAACLATGRTTQRPVALAVLAAAGLTQAVFPVGWPALVSGSAAVTDVLVARNMILAAAAVLSCGRILSASSLGHEGPSPLPQQGHRGGQRRGLAAQPQSTSRGLLHHPAWRTPRAAPLPLSARLHQRKGGRMNVAAVSRPNRSQRAGPQ
jgi:hypothetical protein